MSKIKSLIHRIHEKTERVTSHYSMTTILVIITALLTSFFIDRQGELGQYMEYEGLPRLYLFGIGTFFVETFFAENKIAKTCGFISTALAAVGLTALSNSESALTAELAGHWSTAYIIVLITLGIYGNFKKSGLPFNQWCLRVVHEFVKLAIVCGITALGIALVTATFVTLLMNGNPDNFFLIFRAEFLVMGILAGIGFLDALLNPDAKLSSFYLFIVRYLLTILLLVAFAIIYGYILKIIITRIVPSNEIFRILTCLFILGLPIWTLIGTFPDDHWLVRIGGKLPYIFIPFLFLQGYAIRERITAFGLTPHRYLCLALMVFEVLYILVYALRRRETGIMLPVFAVMTLICLVLPGVNMYSISNRSQKAIFDRYAVQDFETEPTEEQSLAAGAYYFLMGSEAGKAMLVNADPEKIAAIESSGMVGRWEYDQYIFINNDIPVRDADISEFDRLTAVTTYKYESDSEESNHFDPAAIIFYDLEGNQVLTADISAFLNARIAAQLTGSDKSDELSGEVDLPDGSRLLITHCEARVEAEQKITWLKLDGVLLGKAEAQ